MLSLHFLVRSFHPCNLFQCDNIQLDLFMQNMQDWSCLIIVKCKLVKNKVFFKLVNALEVFRKKEISTKSLD